MIRVAGSSQTGPIRLENQDAYLVGSTVSRSTLASYGLSADSELLAAHGLLVAVADGMGGYAGGALASWTVLSTIAVAFHRDRGRPYSRESAIEAVEEAVAESQQVLAERLQTDGLGLDAGTTLAGAVFGPDGSLVVFGVGDSRVLWVGRAAARQLTVDDTPVGPGLAEGRIQVEQALRSDDLGLTRAITGDTAVRVRIAPEDAWRPGDRYVLGSDGWHGLGRGLPIDDVVAALRWGPSSEDVCRIMIDEAVARDGSDNATAVVVYCDEGR